MQIILMLSEIRKPKLDQFPNQLFVFLSVVWKIALALFSLTQIYIYIHILNTLYDVLSYITIDHVSVTYLHSILYNVDNVCICNDTCACLFTYIIF